MSPRSFAFLFVLSAFGCQEDPSFDTGDTLDAMPSYAPDSPCGPEIWTVACPSCEPEMEPLVVEVRCEYSSDHILDALQQAFGDYAIWREENPTEDLTINRVQEDRRSWKNG